MRSCFVVLANDFADGYHSSIDHQDSPVTIHIGFSGTRIGESYMLGFVVNPALFMDYRTSKQLETNVHISLREVKYAKIFGLSADSAGISNLS